MCQSSGTSFAVGGWHGQSVSRWEYKVWFAVIATPMCLSSQNCDFPSVYAFMCVSLLTVNNM